MIMHGNEYETKEKFKLNQVKILMYHNIYTKVSLGKLKMFEWTCVSDKGLLTQG